MDIRAFFFTDLYGASYTDKGKDGKDYEIFPAKVRRA
jgi:hypothetical protein